MSLHRFDNQITELKTYFNSVLDWVSRVFDDVEPEMCGLEWGRMYVQYHLNPYNPAAVSAQVHKLYGDPYIKRRKGIFEYILGGSADTRLLEVRVFDDATKKTVYEAQTTSAKAKNESNCPLCAIGPDANKRKIWKQSEMDADHVASWSKGGSSSMDNCQMLCQTHNRAKGNS